MDRAIPREEPESRSKETKWVHADHFFLALAILPLAGLHQAAAQSLRAPFSKL